MDKLRKEQSPKRYAHCLNVADCARALAERFYEGIGEEAYIAGLLHDCAKHLRGEDMISKAIACGIEPDEIERAEPHLLHAKVGAMIARDEYAVQDARILQAIRRHIGGAPDMTPLDIVVNLADYIEPGRGYPGVDKVRELAREDAELALMEGFKHTMIYLLESRMCLHPDTLLTYNTIYIRRLNSLK